MGDAFAERMWEEYERRVELDSKARHRAEQWWAVRVFFGVRFAVERRDDQEWVDSLLKLREGPVLG
jgi:hypothetical protein